MGRSSVRPVVRGFIAEQYVRSLFTATSPTCFWTAEVRVLNPKFPLCAGRSEVSQPAFYPVFRTNPVRDTTVRHRMSTALQAYLNKTREIDCEWWDEVARWCQSTTRGRRLSLCLPQEDETRGLH